MKTLIKEILNQNPILKDEIKGLPDIGKRKDGNNFSEEIDNLVKSINFVSKETKKLEKSLSQNVKKYSFASGDPLNNKPFKYSIYEMKKILKSNEQYKYYTASGDEKSRSIIVNYLIKEGFKNSNSYKNSKVINNGLSIDNVALTLSTTQAFSIVLDVILKPYDVIIVPGPNYSLFTISAERINAFVEILPLREEDNWIVNPTLLRKKINDINAKLKEKYKNNPSINYIPRVKAYLNCNPSNPTGKVLSEKDIDILDELLEVANEKDVFIIDDMVYRDICYEESNKAKPLATLGRNFENTITLFGLSKSYGLASTRAGFVVADEIIVREIRNKIFQHMDSLPNIQVSALVGAFNDSSKRYNYYKKYFKPIREQYLYRYNIIVALVSGIDKVKDIRMRNKIERLLSKVIPEEDKKQIMLNGISGIELIPNMIPEAGFFTLLDFTKLKHKKYKKHTIETDLDLLRFFFCEGRIKFLIGSSLAFPDKNKLIARITFALEPKELVKSFYQMYKTIKLLSL